MMSGIVVRPFSAGDEEAVISLWRSCNLVRPWNNPKLDIQRKLKVNPDLFLVGTLDNMIVATAIGGYEGHRGWVNYLAVDPRFRRDGIGRQMMGMIEERLLTMGCPKINLQIRIGNLEAIEFYRRIGFKPDEAVSMGKRLVADE
jgi:ribosomal protein S18 acetylase RimI-like enzyme